MTDTAQPIAVIPATGPTMVARKMSVITAILGVGVFVATPSPAFTLTSYLYDSGIATVYLSNTPDGGVFLTLGGLIFAFSWARFYTDDITWRILISLTGAALIALCALDAQAIWDGVDTRLAGTGMTLTFTPLFPFIGTLGALAILGSCFSRELGAPRG